MAKGCADIHDQTQGGQGLRGRWAPHADSAPRSGDLDRQLRQAKTLAALGAGVFQVLGRDEQGDLVERLLQTIQGHMGFDAVAVHLGQDESFPDSTQKGLCHKAFCKSSLLAFQRSASGGGDLDRPVPDCLCARVLTGRTGSDKALFTEGGSFWTNDMTELLAEVGDADHGVEDPSHCDLTGYESVGLIPLKAPDGVAGLLQLSDRRGGRFTREMIEYLESVGAGIGLAMRRRGEAEQFRRYRKTEAVARLVGGVAHDFRNQLTVIRGYAEMLTRRGLVAGKGEQYVEEVIRAAEVSTLVTGQLLALGRKKNFQPRVVDLGDMVQAFVKTMGRILGEDIRLNVRCHAAPCPVWIDPELFQQAMMNLLSHAREAMPAGGKLVLETSLVEPDLDFGNRHPVAPPGPYGLVAVRGDGCGPAEGALGRLPEASTKATEQTGPAGMGLAMVRGLVKQSDGHVEVEPRPGEGTTVKLYFPVWRESSSTNPQPQAGDASVGCGSTVLVVEDEQPVRRLIAEMLRGGGCEVQEASSADEAMAMLARGDRVDLLLTDVVMPGRNGQYLASQIRRTQPELPVLFITGYSEGELLRRGLTIDPAAVLAKPCSEEQLLDRVRRMLSGGRGRAAG